MPRRGRAVAGFSAFHKAWCVRVRDRAITWRVGQFLIENGRDGCQMLGMSEYRKGGCCLFALGLRLVWGVIAASANGVQVGANGGDETETETSRTSQTDGATRLM